VLIYCASGEFITWRF